MTQYSKAIAAGVFLLALAAKNIWQIDLSSDTQNKIVDVILALIGTFSVYQVPNTGGGAK